ncbi:hypothetical protein OS493_034644 [Desmophyllum pertusum]|uniref:Uncharacterized protein n=1 Tax=Desmophyllum pertusum TaxID=174260 RepID=A0A9X0D1Q3_9CNID|nr:hypothetical protein OS493_034644 [Desmophyllum pertusum]
MMTHFKTSARTIFIIISLNCSALVTIAQNATKKNVNDSKLHGSLVDCSVPVPVAQYPTAKEINDSKLQGFIVGDAVSLAAGPCGKPNGSYQFPGTNSSYIKFPGIGVIDSITVLCWVYVSNRTSGYVFRKNACVGCHRNGRYKAGRSFQ